MTRVPQQILRLATLLIGVSATSVALAVATVEVTYTGPKSKIDETTIQLFDSNGKPAQVKPVDDNRNRFTIDSGTYSVAVYVGGKEVSRSKIPLADGNNTLRVDSETGTVEVVPPGATRTPFELVPGVQPSRLWGSIGPGGVTDKAPTIGVFPATDTSLLSGPSRITTVSANISLSLLKDLREACRWSLNFMDGHRSTSTQVPVGTNVGWTYFADSPTGSTGLASNLGANANLKTTYQDFGLSWFVPYLLNEDPLWGEPMLGYQYSKVKYEGMISNLTVPGVASSTNQNVKENDLIGGWGLRTRYMSPGGASFSGGVGLAAIYYWGKYDGSQNNTCPVCAPAVQNYNVSNSNSKSGLTFGAWANAAVGFQVSKDAQIFVAGMYRYDHAVATLVNRVSPSDPAPHLSTGDRNWASVEFGFEMKFQ